MNTGQESQHSFDIGAKFIRESGSSRIVARSHNAATIGHFAEFLETDNVVPLPTMQGYRDAPRGRQSGFRIDTEGGIAFARIFVGNLDRGCTGIGIGLAHLSIFFQEFNSGLQTRQLLDYTVGNALDQGVDKLFVLQY